MILEMVKPLNNDNYLLFAMKHYDNPQCVNIEEFHDDLNRTKYLKRLFKKYENSKVLKERLILNHLIILNNVFGVESSARILFFRIEEEYHSLLKTFLVYLNCLPEKEIPEVDLIAIPLEHEVMKILREI
tara:strand:+ start:2286 stop:2675 length:390 start_codon:yes stop_codon:yes gene_type:complete